MAKDDVEPTLSKEKFCLMGKIMVDKRINKDAFKVTMIKVWKFARDIRIFEVGANLFLFELCPEQVLKHVWEGKPWLFDQQLICLQYFDGFSSPTNLVFNHAFLWVQLHDMPLCCLNYTVGAQIGKVIHVDVDDSGHGWGEVCMGSR